MKNDNIIVGNFGFSMCHDVERAIKSLQERGYTPTHFFFGKAPDKKNDDYIKSVLKEEKIYLRFRFAKALRPDQFVMFGRKLGENSD